MATNTEDNKQMELDLDFEEEDTGLDKGKNGDGDGEGDRDEESERAIEMLARAQGWVPKERYNKDPGTWVDAATFVKRGESIASDLRGKIDALQLQLAEQQKAAQDFAAFQKKQFEEKSQLYEAQIKELKRGYRSALREGDDDAADYIESQIEGLQAAQQEAISQSKGTAPAGTPQATSGQRPLGTLEATVLSEWEADNQWIKDPQMQQLAQEMGIMMRQKGETAVLREFLDKLTSNMKATFPKRFKAMETPKGDSMGSSGRGTSSTKTVRRQDLSKEDLALMQRFIRQGLTTEEEFLKSMAR